MGKLAHATREPGRDVARAWVTTVINPLIEAIQREQYWLQKKNWSWRYPTGWFEYLAPISGYIDLRYHANYELFRAEYDEIGGLFDEHDNSLDTLATILISLYNKVLRLPNFKEEFQKLERECRLQGMDYENVWGAVSLQDRPRLLAQYIVNNTQELSSFFTTSKLWNTFGKHFLNLRNNPDLEPIVSKANEEGRRILKVSRKIERKLKDLRNEYARKYDIPPIPVGEF